MPLICRVPVCLSMSSISPAASAIFNHFVLTMSSRNMKTKSTFEVEGYEEAVRALNNLQTNAAVLQQRRKDGSYRDRGHFNIPASKKYLQRCGISLDDLDKLSVIHVAGTKGKGSTCAFVESILKQYGAKTGFYSSPHLVEVRERFRIGGEVITKKCFTSYFWEVYNLLQSQKGDEHDMPAYFKFLTVLAFKMFISEGVDVAIMEVGIGGEYDCTNVVRKPTVCGITTLDYDHTALLGNTLSSIAWHKAGIMKSDVPTFTASYQPSDVVPVFLQRAAEKKTKVYEAPPLEDYYWGYTPIHLGLAGMVQHINASLALQLSHYWLHKRVGKSGSTAYPFLESCILGESDLPRLRCFTLSQEDRQGLQSVVWPGRSQIIHRDPFTFYLDGAHTNASMEACASWFCSVSHSFTGLKMARSVFKVLFFNSTGNRDPEPLLKHLVACKFDLAIFVTNLATMAVDAKSDQTNYMVTIEDQHLRCVQQRNCWINLVRSSFGKKTKNQQNGYIESVCLPGNDVPTVIFPCIQNALVWLSSRRNSELMENGATVPTLPDNLSDKLRTSRVEVLVTGSLHLIGGLLGLLDPGLTFTTEVYDKEQNKDFVCNDPLAASPGAP